MNVCSEFSSLTESCKQRGCFHGCEKKGSSVELLLRSVLQLLDSFLNTLFFSLLCRQCKGGTKMLEWVPYVSPCSVLVTHVVFFLVLYLPTAKILEGD